MGSVLRWVVTHIAHLVLYKTSFAKLLDRRLGSECGSSVAIRRWSHNKHCIKLCYWHGTLSNLDTGRLQEQDDTVAWTSAVRHAGDTTWALSCD